MKTREIDFIVHVKTILSPDDQETIGKKFEDIENVLVVFGTHEDVEIKTIKNESF